MDSLNDKRIKCIEFLQSFGIFLVIMGHSIPKANSNDTIPEGLKMIYDTIYSFHMPLFFVLAGFLLMHSFSRHSKSVQNFFIFIKKKFRRLIIPYFAIGTLAYLLKIFFFNKFAYRPAELNLLSYIKSFVIPWNNPNIYLWFLPTIFFILILGYIVLQKENCKNFNCLIWLILSFLVSFMSMFFHINILNISGVLYYLFYFFIGVFIYNKREIVFKYLSNIGIVVFFLILFWELKILTPCQNNILMNVTGYARAILGILVSFSLAISCSNSNKKFIWGLIDGQYYQIYLLSGFFQCGTRIFYQLHLINYLTVCFIMLISSFIFPVLISHLIKKYIPKLKIFIGL